MASAAVLAPSGRAGGETLVESISAAAGPEQGTTGANLLDAGVRYHLVGGVHLV